MLNSGEATNATPMIERISGISFLLSYPLNTWIIRLKQISILTSYPLLIIDCNTTITTKGVELTQPNYPNPFEKNLDCYQLIQFNESETVTLTFFEFFLDELDRYLSMGNCMDQKE